MSKQFELILPADFDARAEYEAEQRGLLDYVKVRLADGRTYSICFFTPSRIAVELELIRQAGEACFAEPGLIVIHAIVRGEMENAVGFLIAAGHFERLQSD
jgi:hypothetical protein